MPATPEHDVRLVDAATGETVTTTWGPTDSPEFRGWLLRWRRRYDGKLRVEPVAGDPQPVDKAVGCRYCGNLPGPVCDAPGCLARDAAASAVAGVDYDVATCSLCGSAEPHTHPDSELYEDVVPWAERDEPCPARPR